MTDLKPRDRLMRVINNIAPTDKANLIRFNGGLVKAWEDGKNLWIRTRYKLLYPTHLPHLAAKLNGINVYKTRYSPVISIMGEDGKVVRLKLEDQNGG
jgi:hypothetical protein